MKTIFTIALLLVLGAANAQREFGVRGGVNVNHISNSYGTGLDQPDQLQSFNAGVFANIPFFIFSFQPSLVVQGKGSKVTYGDPNGTADYFIAETNPIYLELPATFNINLHFGDLSGLYAGAGPYIATGIGGSNRVHGRREGTEFAQKDKIIWSNDDPKTLFADEGAAYGTYRKFDYGLELNAGFFLTRLHIGIFYDYGLTRINTVSNSNQSDNLRLRTLGFSAGFAFGG